MAALVPAPVSVRASDQCYEIRPDTRIQVVAAGSPEAARIGEQLAVTLRRSTGFRLPVTGADGAGGIVLSLASGAGEEVGSEGYHLVVDEGGVVIRANRPAGLFNGIQTLRQLLPVDIESDEERPGPWLVPGGEIVDYPRFGYRGAMLDVARHFFGVADVRRYIDQVSRYKINHLHLHLTDDQGWRIAVAGWPRLTTIGASTCVGGGPGGYYSRDDYRQIVEYARDRNITVVPEIDTPGHVNAALSAYPELNADGVAPEPYTGIDVGFSSLCADQEITYRFLDEVFGEIAELTPGPYLHIGGDEAKSTTERDYRAFVDRVLPIVAKHGKTAVAWHELAKVAPPEDTVIQFWGTSSTDVATAVAARRGNKIIMSPSRHSYLDQKYHKDTPIGLHWAANIDVREAYGWDPAGCVDGVGEASILGVEAPLWAETLKSMADIEYLAFPRLPAIAELGWSPAGAHDWESFRRRLAAHGPRWTAMGINFYASEQIPWVE